MAAEKSRRKYVQRQWRLGEAETPEARTQAAELAGALKLSHITARILVRRGCATLEQADAFMSRRMDLLHDPLLLPDIHQAVARISEAVEKKQRILLFGDYDVDGLSATALLTRFLKLLQQRRQDAFELDALVPERSQGYGLSAEALRIVKERRPDLLIALDNGTSSGKAIVALREAGIDTIVVDHHHIGEALPPAVAVINPRRADNARYPFDELCAAGVTFKLTWALAMHFSQNKRVTPEFKAFLLDAFALAGAGTLADVAPLVGENRVLAHHGLAALAHTRTPGLKALLETAGIHATPTSGEVSFRIAPRLNAAGRCGHAAEALELLLTDDAARAAELAAKLEHYNSTRQTIEAQILDQAREQSAQLLRDNPDCRALVLHAPSWQTGVVGIVAARIVEEFHRPALLLCVDAATGLAQGSGRSIRALHLYEALHRVKEHLVSFGGHAAAAGVTLKAEKLGELRQNFESVAAEILTADDLISRLHVDDTVTFEQITPRLAEELELFEPCGAGNARPVLAALSVSLPSPPRLMGRDERHVSFFARQGQCSRRIVAFDCAEHFNTLCELAQGRLDVAFRPRLNSYRGETNLELMLEAFRSEKSTTETLRHGEQ